ncbi:FAD-binding and (Fe-S)-binding domain-containing protein [Ornithinicoccus halotolerans]|uniref:FAD-binding and (Fe-S)-binding domain-containing protein n=1 Tax=Ornithinicoccus halotolerans TaxID=1748220 RepID=UPI001E543B90|nr:FAD-binding and (Fe-S)-binding domain-containing protein [Ornithinicoccus halotolerans]
MRSLQATVRGEVRDDDGTRALYATDASNHRVVPRCVVFPRDAADVLAVVGTCAEDGVPITTRGAGTNCAGNAVGPGVVLDLSRHMTGPPAVDAASRTATVQPGLVLDRLQDAAAPHGLMFGADPSTHSRCTLGGMIGTNACGSHSVAWGTTADNVESLDVVTSDGQTVTLGGPHAVDTPLAKRLLELRERHLGTIRTDLGQFGRQLSGYGLHHLTPEHGTHLARSFVGSEGTCGIVTRATVRLQDRPQRRALVVAGFADEVHAATAAPRFVPLGVLTVEAIDRELVLTAASRRAENRAVPLPAGDAWLLLEVGADDEDGIREATTAAMRVAREVGARGTRVLLDSAQQRAVWAVREQGAGLASRSLDGTEFWPGWEDAAVPPERLGEYLEQFRQLMASHDRRGMIYGHFGEGCVHVRIDHDLLTPGGRASFRRFQEEAAELVAAHGGSLSGEHGDGRARSELLSTLYGAKVLEAFRQYKGVFDAENLFNPGVLVDPDPLDSHLRAAHLPSVTSNLGFLYPADDGDFGKALRRCTGVGACRKTAGGGMCPSYRATSEEQHSTRGRARLLAEMADGEVITDGWRSAAVAEALDLCLSCKACSSECPVGVDMATYKAEFLHQRFRGRVRPRTHYSMGWLPLLLAAARLTPRIGNRVLRAPVVQRVAKRLGGIDERRELPVLAEQSFRRWFRRHNRQQDGDPVILWIDCFTSSFSPSAARAATLLLERAGYRVLLAPRGTCCGITWISTGQLDVARRVLSRSVRLLGTLPEVPIVSLEPSCATAVRHDSRQLLDEPEADRVAGRVRTLAEALVGRGLPFSREPVRAVNQIHCHQRATVGAAADRRLAVEARIEMAEVAEGCCGLAGNFGFEQGHYDVSVACAEEALLPAARQLRPDDVFVADGFSCRLQSEQLAGRRPLHLAEAILDRIAPTEFREQSRGSNANPPSPPDPAQPGARAEQ